MTGNEEVPPKKGIARWLYERLLSQIEHGVWPYGHQLPSEEDLEFYPIGVWLHGQPPSEEELKNRKEKTNSLISRTTIRIALTGLADIGRVINHHGKGRSAYMPSMEPHWLAVDLPKPASMKLAAVAEPLEAEPHPAVEFIPADGSEATMRWHESKDEYTVPAWDSERLGIDTGTKLRMYTLTLLIDGEPILTSISLVPSDLLGGAVTWQQQPVGELALAGVSATYSYPTLHSRVPTLEESESLEPVPGIPAFVVYRQCQVVPIGVPAIPRRACVVVIARADRVHL